MNARVGATETILGEVRATSITKDDFRAHEERVTKALDNVGRQVTGEVDRLVRVMESPKPNTRSRS